MEFAPIAMQANRLTHEAHGWHIQYATALSQADTLVDKKPRVLVAIHGFARPLEDMLAWASQWPEPRLFISIHLPHHGESGPTKNPGPDDQAIQPKVLMQIIREIALIEGGREGLFDLIGYSIGGRIALALLAESPESWGRVLLLAPDGLKKSLFYAFTVHTKWGRIFWFWLDRHAESILRGIDRLLDLQIISKHLHAFGHFHLSSHPMRMMVWKGWRTHRACWPSHQKITNSCTHLAGPLDLIFGDRDRIIPPANGHRLKRLMPSVYPVGFHTIPSGHAMMHKETIQSIIQCIFPT